MSEGKLSRAACLDMAKHCVCGEREQDYGAPEDNFSLIADLWSVYLGIDVTARDVGLMMILLKIARARSGDKLDNLVDAAGYAACVAEIISKDGE